MKHSNFTQALNEVIELKIRVVNEYMEENIKPLLKDIAEQERKIFEKALKEVKELEEEV